MTRRPAVAALLVLAAACGSSSDPELIFPDAGTATDGRGAADAAVAQLACEHVRVLPQYPWGVTAGTFVSSQRVTFGIMGDSTSTAASRLTLEVWPGPGGAEPTLPIVRALSTADRYKTCETCVVIGEGCTTEPNTCKTYFFAQAGQLRVEEAGRSSAAGRLRANGTNITLAEWSLQADAPVPDGRCITLSNFSMNAEWGEGGTCSGDPCGSGGSCCSDSPYCSLGNNNIGRFCSDFCGESGDGCTGPSDCCDGYSCFLGTCIVESCGGDTCSAGLDEGGGCCDQSAYCVDGGCRPSCGMTGDGCGGDLDCCTGLSCSAGTCQ